MTLSARSIPLHAPFGLGLWDDDIGACVGVEVDVHELAPRRRDTLLLERVGSTVTLRRRRNPAMRALGRIARRLRAILESASPLVRRWNMRLWRMRPCCTARRRRASLESADPLVHHATLAQCWTNLRAPLRMGPPACRLMCADLGSLDSYA